MKCPGQDMQYWTAGAIYEVDCPACGKPVEFYKDDTTRSCGSCGHRFVNPKMDFGCAAYCQYAEQCIGTLPEEFTGAREDLMKDKIAVAVKRYYQKDFKAISYISRLARHVESISKAQGANLAAVLCAAYLSTIGKEEARRAGSSDDTAAVIRHSLNCAASMLAEQGAGEAMIEAVSRLIEAYLGSAADKTAETAILHDAELLARTEDRIKEHPPEPGEVEQPIETQLLTGAGKRLGRDLFGTAPVC